MGHDIGTGSEYVKGGIELGSGGRYAIVANMSVEIIVPQNVIRGKCKLSNSSKTAEGNPFQLFERIVTVVDARNVAPITSSRSRKNNNFDLCVDNELRFAKDPTISSCLHSSQIVFLVSKGKMRPGRECIEMQSFEKSNGKNL
ncbi:hypothetical protein L2E82_02676 [Cichorium intybus]|uniref:Uncharacterized protein n=1 Tax=Cichorium intybus TaxID=13427 RepID=A0ACB9H2U3_CICIN|nr:hypothetical protein L2E82_02676 [Cichorium intybus]